MNKSIFDVHYGDGRTALVMEADLDRGWRRLHKTYGFFAQTRIPYRNDLRIRAQITVIAQPGNFEKWASRFANVELNRDESHLSYMLRERRLVLNVPLSADQRWRTTEQGRPEIFVEQLPLFVVDSMHCFDLRAWIIFHEGSPRPVPDVRIWAESNLVLS